MQSAFETTDYTEFTDCEDAERWLNAVLPAGAKLTDAVYESRLRQTAAAADKAGFRHGLFQKANGETDE